MCAFKINNISGINLNQKWFLQQKCLKGRMRENSGLLLSSLITTTFKLNPDYNIIKAAAATTSSPLKTMIGGCFDLLVLEFGNLPFGPNIDWPRGGCFEK